MNKFLKLTCFIFIFVISGCSGKECFYNSDISEVTFTDSNISNSILWDYSNETFFIFVGNGDRLRVQLGEPNDEYKVIIENISEEVGQSATAAIENEIIPAIDSSIHWDGTISATPIDIIEDLGEERIIKYSFDVDLMGNDAHIRYQGTFKQTRTLAYCANAD